MDVERRTVTLSVASRAEIATRARAAAKGEAQGAHITFASTELLWQVITPKRLDILKALAGQGPLSIREVARRVGRDVKAVHGEVHGLANAGVVDLGADGVRFDYDEVHVDFRLNAA